MSIQVMRGAKGRPVLVGPAMWVWPSWMIRDDERGVSAEIILVQNRFEFRSLTIHGAAEVARLRALRPAHIIREALETAELATFPEETCSLAAVGESFSGLRGDMRLLGAARVYALGSLISNAGLEYVSARFECSHSTATRLIRRARERGLFERNVVVMRSGDRVFNRELLHRYVDATNDLIKRITEDVR